MYRKMIGIFALFILGMLATACSGHTGENGTVVTDKPTPTATEAVTPTEGATPTATATPTPTTAAEVTPTVEVTPTEGPLDLAALAAKNRELHEAIVPKTTANPLGTSPAYTEQDKKDYEYGIERVDGIRETNINMLTGGEAAYEDQYQYTQISGLKNTELQKKINDRIKTAVETMANPGYLPNVSGIMAIVKQRGLPESRVYCCASGESGILSVDLSGTWYWSEERVFADYDELNNWDSGWSGNGPAFSVYTDVNSEDDGTLKVHVEYRIREYIYLNIDMVTGEDVALSDIFPEGFDYITYVNEQIEEQSRYVFWFDDYTYQSTGEIGNVRGGWDNYDASMEYDGGRKVMTVTGDEMFYIYSGTIYLGINYRIDLPFMIANRNQNGADLFTKASGCYTGRLGIISLCDCDTDGPIDPKEIGSFRTSLNGKDKIKVQVFRGDMTPRIYTEYDREQTIKEEWLPRFSDEKIIELAEECMKFWGDPVDPKSDCKMFFMGVDVYPHGYVNAEWYVYRLNEEGYWDVYFDSYYGMAVWLKDGDPISEEELYDVSYEELLTELIGSLRDENNGAIVSGEEMAKGAAQALMPYFVGLRYPLEEISRWDWNSFLFRWTEGGTVVSGKPYESSDIPKDLQAVLPRALWESLNGEWRVIESQGGSVIRKHLRMYEGYPFP